MGAFEGKVALITGGSSGIGRATALAFAREGAKVVIAARGAERGLAVVREIEVAGGGARFVICDVTKADNVARLLGATVDAYGRLDCAFNNAASTDGVFQLSAEFSEEEFDRAITANLKSVWLCLKHEIRQMLAQTPPGGAIVNTSSVNGLGGAARGARRALLRSQGGDPCANQVGGPGVCAAVHSGERPGSGRVPNPNA